MQRLLFLCAAFALLCSAQQVRWSATSGDVVLNSSAMALTVQQPATGAGETLIDEIVVYCSAACNATQSANGTAATTTAGTVVPLLPASLDAALALRFFTASNAGAGTAQGGIVHIPAGGTVSLCLSPACGAAGQVKLAGNGTGKNWTLSIASTTATVNVTFYGRVVQ